MDKAQVRTLGEVITYYIAFLTALSVNVHLPGKNSSLREALENQTRRFAFIWAVALRDR